MVQSITLLSTLSILAPLVVGAIFYFRMALFTQWLFGFVVFTFLGEVASRVLFELGINNMYLFHVYSFGEVFFICMIYRSLSNTERQRNIILIGFLIFQSISILNLVFFENIEHFNSVQRYVEMMIVYSLLSNFIVRAVNDPTRRPFEQDPAILLTLGLMIYFLGTLFLFIYGNEVLSGSNNNYWILHGIFNIFLNAVYVLVFLKAVRKFAGES